MNRGCRTEQYIILRIVVSPSLKLIWLRFLDSYDLLHGIRRTEFGHESSAVNLWSGLIALAVPSQLLSMLKETQDKQNLKTNHSL